ncbi:MAG: phasin family protein [Gammaproteobacteria bacterium]|nr:phasin family protein [Gammaproteobacteria bacterium]
MTEQFTKAFSQFKVPGLDVNDIIASQQKNLEALTAANQAAMAGIQAIAARQTEIMQQTMTATASAAEEMVKSGSPQAAAAKQVDLVKTSFQKALADMTEIAQMVAKSNSEAGAAINKRMTESLEEVKKMGIAAK